MFDKDLSRIKSSIVDIGKREEVIGDLFFENEIKVFTELTKGKSHRTLFCYVFDLKKQTHTVNKLYETVLDGRNTLFSELKNHQTLLAQSPDGNYLAIATDNLHKDDDSYLVRVFNAKTFKKIFETTFLEHSEHHFELQDLIIDNEGEVYSLGKQFLDGRQERNNDKPNYKFILFHTNSKNVNPLQIELSALHIESLSILPIGNEIHLLGLYSEEKIGKVKGGCNFIVDKENFVIKQQYKKDLPIEIYRDIYPEGKANRKRENELGDFYINYLRTDKYDNVYLLAERTYTTINSMPGSGMVAGSNYGYAVSEATIYNEILILKFSSDGELEWGRCLYKESSEHSYNAFLKNKNLHIVLNSGKDLKEKRDGRIKISKGIFESKALYDFVFTENGKMEINKILEYKNRETYLPNLGSFFGNQLIMPALDKRKKHFGILKVN